MAAVMLILCICTAAPCQRGQKKKKRTSMCKIVATLQSTDNGKSLTLHTGEGLTVALEEMASAGYLWQSKLQPEGILTLQNSVRTERQDSGAGGSMLRTMTFCAAAPGLVEVKLELRRRWETDGKPAETFHFRVTSETK